MDSRLERLKSSLLNSWFPQEIEIFGLPDVTDMDELMVHLFRDLTERFRTAFPGFRGRVYQDYNQDNPLYLKNIDPNIIRFLGLTPTVYPSETYGYDSLRRISGRSDIAVDNGNSYYISDSAALELYSHITVDEWSGRLSKPLEMYDDNTGDEFIYTDMSDFIVFLLVERIININNIQTNLYQPLEAFIVYNLALYVANALGRYPLSLALKTMGEDDTSGSTTTTIDPGDLSSITISGKLSLSLAASSAEDYEKLSDLFSSGSGGQYLEQLKEIYLENKKIFDVLKYERTGGMSLI